MNRCEGGDGTSDYMFVSVNTLNKVVSHWSVSPSVIQKTRCVWWTSVWTSRWFLSSLCRPCWSGSAELHAHPPVSYCVLLSPPVSCLLLSPMYPAFLSCHLFSPLSLSLFSLSPLCLCLPSLCLPCVFVSSVSLSLLSSPLSLCLLCVFFSPLFVSPLFVSCATSRRPPVVRSSELWCVQASVGGMWQAETPSLPVLCNQD